MNHRINGVHHSTLKKNISLSLIVFLTFYWVKVVTESLMIYIYSSILLFLAYRFNIKEDCTLNSDKQKRINKILFSFLLITFSLSLFLSLEKLSSIYFDEYIVPAQKKEYQEKLTEWGYQSLFLHLMKRKASRTF